MLCWECKSAALERFQIPLIDLGERDAKQEENIVIPGKARTKPNTPQLNLWALVTLQPTSVSVILCTWNPSEKRKQPYIPRHIPMQDGRGLSQALLSPVIHFSVEAPCRVYPGSHLYVMLLPAKWPWSLTFRPNWGTPGSSQWDNSKPKQKKIQREWSGVFKKEYILLQKRELALFICRGTFS